MKKDTILNTISSVLIALFVYAAFSKLLALKQVVFSLQMAPLTSSFPKTFSIAVPVAELGIAGLLFARKTVITGIYASAIILMVFTAYIVYMLAAVPNLPCTCGGVISQLTWKQHVLFNLFFIVLALAAILVNNDVIKTRT